MREDFRFGSEGRVPLVAFARQPPDARTACIAVIEVQQEPEREVAACRELGAPVVLACDERGVQWWKQCVERPELQEQVPAEQVERFVQEHRKQFEPLGIYRAKTQGRLYRQLHLEFVDELLMPAVESDMGRRLGEAVYDLISELEPFSTGAPSVHQHLKDAFWLLAAKILRDKGVPSFRGLELADAGEVFRRVGRHYGEPRQLLQHRRGYLEALGRGSVWLNQLGHLGQVTTEALAGVYERLMVTEQLRKQHGIHSTPPFLTDYILGRLQERIQQLPAEERHVLEPACGPGTFLVAAMRSLRDLLPQGLEPHAYLVRHLHGLELDATALEIARLALTVADIPHADGWQLHRGDMFLGDRLPRLARRAGILLANPPFESFTPEERSRYPEREYDNKAEEMLHRTLPHLPAGAVLGVVVPQGFLRGSSRGGGRELRGLLAREFELDEVLLLPDKVFTFADVEAAVLLGRKAKPSVGHTVYFRRLREGELDDFKQTWRARSDRQVAQERFAASPNCELYLPELQELWERGRGWTLDTIAELGSGLVYKGKALLAGAVTFSEQYFSSAVPGHARADDDLMLHGQPSKSWLNLDEEVIRRPGLGTQRDKAQLLIKRRPTRYPWRGKAVIDREGHPTRDVFLIARPRSEDCPLEWLWALCNSPYANAYIHAHVTKGDIHLDLLRDMPIPQCSQEEVERVVREVRAYLEAAERLKGAELERPREEWACQVLLRRIDALVLRLYDLPPRLERKLLDLFDEAGHERPGVPFNWLPYLPRGFQRRVPYHVYLARQDAALADIPALEELPAYLAPERLSQLSSRELEQEINMIYEELADLENFRLDGGTTRTLMERSGAQRRRVKRLEQEAARRLELIYRERYMLPSEREPDLVAQAMLLLEKYGNPTR